MHICLDSLAGFFFSKDLLYFPYVRRLRFAGESYAYRSTDMTYVAIEVTWIFLVIFRLCRISKLDCDTADLIKPSALIIRMIVSIQIAFKDFAACGRTDLLGQLFV